MVGTIRAVAALLAFTTSNLAAHSTDAFVGAPLAAWSHGIKATGSCRGAAFGNVGRSSVGAVGRRPIVQMSSEGGDASASVPPAGGQPQPIAYQKKQGFFGKYNTALKQQPVITKALTSGIVSTVGYIVAQIVARKAIKGPIVKVRQVAMYALVGTIYVPVVLHYWFAFLESLKDNKTVSSLTKKNKWADSLVQLAFDQTLGAVIVNCGFMALYVVLSAVTGGQPSGPGALFAAARAKISSEFWNMMKANWKLWPVANFVNFALIPLRYRVLVTNLVAVGWHIIMAKMAVRGL